MGVTAGEERRRTRLAHGLLALLVALHIVLALTSLWGKSVTVDEYAHLPAGCAALRHATLDLYGKNPPLVRYLLAAPPVLMGARVPVPDLPTAGAGWDPWTYGDAFVEANAGPRGLGRYPALLRGARVVGVLLGAGLVVLVYAWGRRLHGSAGGLAAAGMTALSPTLLAHDRLVTVDVGATLAATAALLLMGRALLRGGPGRWALAGAAAGAAVASKFTALLLLPVLLSALAVRRTVLPRAGGPRSWGRRAAPAAAFVIAAWLVVQAAYQLRDPVVRLDSIHFFSRLGQGVARVLPGWTPVPLPAAMVRGVDAQMLDLQDAEMPNYLDGQWSRRGWWTYYPRALFLKTPLALWGLALLGLALLLRRRGRRGSEPERRVELILVAVWVAAVLLSSLSSRLNIGVRYLLPALPCLHLLLGGVAARALAAARWSRVALAALTLSYAGATLSAHPHYLPFFNLLAGGSSGGWRHLTNSNVDWGQDLPLLVRWLENEGKDDPRPIHLAYFGHLDPARYGIDYILPPGRPAPGLHVISLNLLVGLPYVVVDHGRWILLGEDLVTPQDEFAWLRERTPVARLGESLWVFRVE